LTAENPVRSRKRQRCFIQVPCAWYEALVKAQHNTTYRLALHLLYQGWKTRSTVINLSNKALAGGGVSPRSKSRALQELTRLGLIAVERKPRRSPKVALLLVE
jgi:hypothetical protein